MNYLIDTCVLSEIVRPRPNRGVVTWMNACKEESVFLSVLTLGEIQKGIDKLGAGKRRNTLQLWLDNDLTQRFSRRILAIDAEVAIRWAHAQAASELRGRPLPTIDGLLCATALAHNLTVVTRNVGDFVPSGVNTHNPWGH